MYLVCVVTGSFINYAQRLQSETSMQITYTTARFVRVQSNAKRKLIKYKLRHKAHMHNTRLISLYGQS